MNFTAADWAAITAHPDTDLDAPATESELAEFERAIGVSLPAGHKELLRRGNGGILGRVRLFGVHRSDALDLRWQIERHRANLGEASQGSVLPFARDWGGRYFGFDLRAPDGEYPVLYWNDDHPDERGSLRLSWSPFAEDFVTFVRRVVVVQQATPPAPQADSERNDHLEYARPDVVRQAQPAGAMARCWPWLLLGQIPAAVGVIWFAALFTGRADPGYLGLSYLVAWCTSVGGTLLSLIITLCFARSRCSDIGCLLAVAHGFYLLILLGIGAWFMLLAARGSNALLGSGFQRGIAVVTAPPSGCCAPY
jgi:hypothetical protein